MSSARRRLRGLLSTALTWGAAFGGFHLALAALQLGVQPTLSPTASRVLVWGAVAWTILGAFSGLAFGAFVVTLERRRTLATLSARRFTLWGALAGAGIVALPFAAYALRGGSATLGSAGILIGAGGVLGLGGAATSLRLARRATPGALRVGEAGLLPPVT